MTDSVLVFDASPLNHFARAGELSALQKIVTGFRCVTTKAVLGELRTGAETHPVLLAATMLDWIETMPCDDLAELYLFGQ